MFAINLKKRKFAKYFPVTAPKAVCHNKLLFCFGDWSGFITKVYLLYENLDSITLSMQQIQKRMQFKDT